ncbi:hypothetical protein POM88_007467 [Heracleum sosnowskyi]|uniref:Aldehyde dehydrogenase domain-containing protein n=1 Tax=Heracleum sosnowskyi TaxID=360622 RepID=A0AAD8J675_9APIA|nr:hypothetical protein POM88_007467 [Heracleum sosnowskyi]
MQVGIPDGVVNVVTGYGPGAGAAISSHMDIDKVSFTGSTKVGRLVMQAAAMSNLKQVSLELGGKSSIIIFDDAELDKAVDLFRKLDEKVQSWVVGDPFDLDSQQGPQFDKKQFGKMIRKNIVGSWLCKLGIMVFCLRRMIAKQEIFGPLMSVLKFKLPGQLQLLQLLVLGKPEMYKAFVWSRSKDKKLQLLQEITHESGIEWNSKSLEQQLYNPLAVEQPPSVKQICTNPSENTSQVVDVPTVSCSATDTSCRCRRSLLY